MDGASSENHPGPALLGRRTFLWAAAAGALAAGCGAPADGAQRGTIVNVNFGASGAFVRNFNPFLSTAAQYGYGGTIYEPLFFFNMAQRRPPLPQLAEGYEFGDGGTRLTFRIREGVRWHDGRPLTAEDVAFTFQLVTERPELNFSGLTHRAARALDATTVELEYGEPAFNELWGAAGRTLIVPKHVWEAFSDPARELNENPIGSGPFRLESFRPQTFLLTRNPDYWEPGKPAIDGLRFIAFSDNSSANQALLAGQLDWGNSFVPNPERNWISIDPRTHLLARTGIYVTCLVPNHTAWPGNDPAVRRAMSLALDRKRIVDVVYFGVAKEPSPELLMTPRDDQFKLAPDRWFTRDVAAARATLENAGYRTGAEGIYHDPQGRPLRLNLKVVTGYTDYIQALQLMTQQFREAGMELVVQQVSSAQFNSDRSNGEFELLMDGQGGRLDPYQNYSQLLSAATTAPVGSTATANWSRFTDPEVEDALAVMKGTEDEAVIAEQTRRIARVVVDQLPYVPIYQNSPNAEFLATKVTGWPTEDNPYAMSRADLYPDLGIVAKTLTPVR